MERNLNDIIPPSRRRAQLGDTGSAPQASPSLAQYSRPVKPQKAPRTPSRFPVGTAIVALLVVAASAGTLYAFSKAQVTVTPMQREVDSTGDHVATAGGGLLPFAVISVEKIATTDVKSEGTENVQQAAQGSIVITNAQAVPQQLIKNTRFESADGHIFRIHDSISVPAAKGGAPGSLTVTVYADASGESFNIPATTFTLPGLKASKAYDQVIAKSEAPMTGGFAGPRPSVAQATKDKAYASLKTELAEKIEAGVTEKVPEGYVLLPGASFVAYTAEPDAPAAGGQLTLSQKATATAVVFPRTALAMYISQANDGSSRGEPVTLANEASLKLTSANGAAPAATDQEFAFSLTGNATIIWVVDPVRVAGAVAGKNRKEADVALSGFPEAEKYSFLIRPFWSTSFPSDPSKISVVISEPSSKK